MVVHPASSMLCRRRSGLVSCGKLSRRPGTSYLMRGVKTVAVVTAVAVPAVRSQQGILRQAASVRQISADRCWLLARCAAGAWRLTVGQGPPPPSPGEEPNAEDCRLCCCQAVDLLHAQHFANGTKGCCC